MGTVLYRDRPCFLRINNVRDASLKLDDLIYVNPPVNAEAIRTKVSPNDLLFSITADLGRTAVVPESLNGAFINQHLALIRLDQKKIHPLFVAWFFAMPYGKSIVMKKNREGVKAGLNFDDIRGFDLVVPPLPLQNQFAAIVEKVESIKDKQAQSLAELENLYTSLSQRAFKGELDLSRVTVGYVEAEPLETKSTISADVKVMKVFSKEELINILKTKAGTGCNFDELWSEIKKAAFEEMPEYEEVKELIYQMLAGTTPALKQTFIIKRKENVDIKEMVLSVNR